MKTIAFSLLSIVSMVSMIQEISAVPSLKDFSCSKTKIDTWDIGKTVECDFKITDPVGVDHISVNLRSPSGLHQQYLYLTSRNLKSGSLQNGVFGTTITFPKHAEPGFWAFELDGEDKLTIVNQLGETKTYTEEIFYGSGFQQWIRVDSPGDEIAPELLDLRCDPKADTTSGRSESIICTARVLENGSGIQTVNAYFSSPSVVSVEGLFFSAEDVDLMETNQNTGETTYILRKEIEVYPGTEPGRWGLLATEPFGITLSDANGNERLLDGIDIASSFPDAFYDVVSESWDTEGSRISSFECSTSIIDLGGNRDLSCTMVTQDNLSGFNYGILELQSPSMDSLLYLRFDASTRTETLEGGGVYTPTLTFPENAQTGVWSVSGEGLILYDNLGNRLIYTVDTMNALNIPTFFRVTGKPKHSEQVTADASQLLPRNGIVLASIFTLFVGFITLNFF